MLRTRSRWTLHLGTTLAVAALFLIQICAGFANPVASGATIESVAIPAGGCCCARSEQGCTGLNAAEAADSCARHCAQSPNPAPPYSGLPASGVSASVIAASTRDVVFPAQRPVLSAAPRAISSTPLIYHLQRLLI